jgi:hypothetical protein
MRQERLLSQSWKEGPLFVVTSERVRNCDGDFFWRVILGSFTHDSVLDAILHLDLCWLLARDISTTTTLDVILLAYKLDSFTTPASYNPPPNMSSSTRGRAGKYSKAKRGGEIFNIPTDKSIGHH